MISQVIIGYRAWAITRQSRELGVFLLGFGFIVTALEWYATVRGRTPTQDEVRSSSKAQFPVNSVTDASYLYLKGK